MPAILAFCCLAVPGSSPLLAQKKADRAPSDDAVLQKLSGQLDKIKGWVGLLQEFGPRQQRDDKISDDGLKQLIRMTGLEELTIRSDKITDAGLALLSKLKNLRRLTVTSSKSPLSLPKGNQEKWL